MSSKGPEKSVLSPVGAEFSLFGKIPGGCLWPFLLILSGVWTISPTRVALGDTLHDTLSELSAQAASGNPAAMVRLGLCYDYGQKGAPRDLPVALSWYRKAAEKAFPPAEMVLSERYEIGRGVSPDEHLAVQWLVRAARHGYPPAEDALGDRYAAGQGVGKNDRTALVWYERAASGGYGESEDLLGERYESGTGLPKDMKKAVRWYLRAARDAGNPDAFTRLGEITAKGLGGVPRNPDTAFFWDSLARNTSLSARKALIDLGKGLSEKRQTRAWKKAMEFRSRYGGSWNRWILRP